MTGMKLDKARMNEPTNEREGRRRVGETQVRDARDQGVAVVRRLGWTEREGNQKKDWFRNACTLHFLS